MLKARRTVEARIGLVRTCYVPSRSNVPVGIRRSAMAPVKTMPFVESRRHFWNPFVTDQTAKAVSKLAADHVAQNEALVDASLGIMKLSSSSELAEDEREVLAEVVNSIFTDLSKKPSDQFDVVFHALRLPGVRAVDGLRMHLYAVLCSILPQKLFAVFEEVGDQLELLVATTTAVADGGGTAANEVACPVFLLRRFVFFLLGDVSLFEESVLEIDVDAVIAELELAVPCIVTCSSFVVLKESADSMVLTARLYSLVAELCAAFDVEKTGRIRLEELSECLIRVVGQEGATKMLAGVKADSEGRIKYHHLSSLLTKPCSP